MTKHFTVFAALIALTIPTAPIVAQDSAASAPTAPQQAKVDLTSDVLAIVTRTDASGKTTKSLEEPTEYTPGTQLSFGTNYVNKGSQPATNVTGTNPLSPAVQLAPDADPELIVSVDGGKTFGTLRTLSVPTETGGKRPATHADVTHVRWTIALIAPGDSGRVAFPVIIR